MNESTPPSFDFWTILLLLVCITGFLLSILLFKKKDRRQNIPIVLIVFGFSCILLEYLFFWTRYRTVYHYFYFFSHSWYLAFAPLLYSYITRFYTKVFVVKWYHFIPAGLSFLLNLVYYFRAEGFWQLQHFQEETLYTLFWNMRSPWLPVLSFALYLFVCRDLMLFFRKEPYNQYESLRNRWSHLLLGFFLLFGLAYTSYYVLVPFAFFSPAWDYAISISMAIGIYGIGYMVFREPSIFNGELFGGLFLKNGNGGRSQMDPSTKAELFNKVVRFIENEKPYRDNELRLVQLADKLGFSSHLLSQLINEKSGRNFNHFINEYRLKEAEKLLTSPTEMTINDIYFDVGFNNKATFYSSFRQKHHCTPTEFKKRHQAS